jgi:hypothetical protein
MKQKQLKYAAVKEINGNWAVKTRYRAAYYTAAETFCIPGRLDAEEMAETIAACLNLRERTLNPVSLPKKACFVSSGANG